VRSLQSTAALKAVLLASGAGIFAMAQPAFAQDAAPVPTQEPVQSTPTADQPPANQVTDQAANPNQPGIVVTGSRIVKKDFQSNSPIVTVDQGLLQNSSTAALESNLNKLPQFTPSKTPTAGGDIQPTATNTPGSATIALRGIGANRSLVLIDGRRATPSNATGVVDITTIPSAAIERVEIISGGASATYGADAVAGVTNFIMKKNFQGIQLDGRAGMAEEGDAFEYEISGIMGADFDDGRGNVSIALSTNKREASYQRNRDFYRQLWTNPNTTATGFFFPAPGINLGFGNLPSPAALATIFPGANPAFPAAGNVIFFNPDGSPFSGNNFATRGTAGFLDAPTDGRPYKKTANGVLGANDDYLYNVLPLTRYNMYMRGNYEINDWIGVFGQGLFSHVHTHTLQEPGPIVGGWGVILDPAKISRSILPAGVLQVLDSRVGPATPGQAGYIAPTPANPNPVQPIVSQANAPFTLQALMPEPRETDTDVDTFNFTAGLQGSVPGSDWTWEIFTNHGESSTFANQTGIYSLSRLRAVITAPDFGKGFKAQGNQGAPGFGFGASTATCTSGLNFFAPPAGGFSQDCLEAISADLKNRSKVKQSIWEANATGSLFDLPAGPLQMAVGASYRDTHYSFLNDTLTTQGRSFQDQALGIYPSGNSAGDINVKELYGELSIPILKDSIVKDFSLELGGRISDYSTTGTSYTYKALGDLAVTDWLRFRGGYNRAERAPNIAELFLAPQQTFAANTAGDPCSRLNPLSFSANPATNPTNAGNVEAVCRVLMDQTGAVNAKTQYYNNVQSNSTFSFAFPTLVGNPNLKPEKADTWTAGIVLSSPFSTPFLSRLRLSVDYYNISVHDAIGPQSIAIALQQCFDVNLNPLVATDPVAAANTAFCQHVPRNADQGVLGNVTTTYVNNGRFKTDGIDAQLDWGMSAGPGTVSLNVVGSYLLNFKSSGLPTNPLVQYAGTFGTVDNGLNGAEYRWKLLTNLGYKWGPASLGLEWQHLPSIEDSSENQFPNGTPTTGAPAYDLFALSGSYDITDNFTLRAGVDNLFDKSPPLTGINTANTSPATNGQLSGGSYNATYYDTLGRRFYVGANMKF